MAGNLVPFMPGMKLGMGFNSYTQSTCMVDAVSFVEEKDFKKVKLEDQMPKLKEAGQSVGNIVNVFKVDQVNCYSLNPLDVGKTLSDLAMHDSDVISALDISGAAEIKTGSFTGKLTGGYYNASQLRKSQINFVVRVMVINLVKDLDKTSIKMESIPDHIKTKEDFNRTYGDCFISGFQYGGVLNGVLNWEVKEGLDVTKVKGQIEGGLNAFLVKGELNIDKSTEEGAKSITVTINWHGGSQLKKTTDDWDIGTLSIAAAGFVENIARNPVKFYALTTKYEHLPAFQKLKVPFKKTVDYGSMRAKSETPVKTYHRLQEIMERIEIMMKEPHLFRKSADPAAYDCTADSLKQVKKIAGTEITLIRKWVEEAEKTPETTLDYEVSADGDPDVINIKLPVRRGKDRVKALSAQQSKSVAPVLAHGEPKACIGDKNTIQNFFMASDNFVWHNVVNGGVVQPGKGLGENLGCLRLSSDPSVSISVASHSGSMHVFAVDDEDLLWCRVCDMQGIWQPWEEVASLRCRSPAAAVHTAADSIHVFILGKDDNQLSYIKGDDRTFSNTLQKVTLEKEGKPVTPTFQGKLEAALTKNKTVAAYAVQMDGKIAEVQQADGKWTCVVVDNQPASKSFKPTLLTYVTSGDAQEQRLVWVGQDGVIYEKIYQDGWKTTEPATKIGDSGKSSVVGVSQNPFHLDIFVLSADNALYWCKARKENEAMKWSGWTPIVVGPCQGDPCAVTSSPGQVDVFVRLANGKIAHMQLKVDTWTPADGEALYM